jgi:signal transduction histidine kinase
LILNAADAMKEVDDRSRELLIATTCDDDHRVRLSVRDTGIGIDPQSFETIFDAFYTTKTDGMGIGLSISRSIIENREGRL